MNARIVFWLLVAVFFAAILFTISGWLPWAVVEPGEVGVATTFGDLDPVEKTNGLHFKAPWTIFHTMNIKTQSYTATPGMSNPIEVSSLEGVPITMDLTVYYRLKPEMADEMYRTVGTDYANIVESKVRAAIRDVMSKYTYEDTYGEKRRVIADDMLVVLQNKFDGKNADGTYNPNDVDRGIFVESVELRKPKMPGELESALISKEEEKQNIIRADFSIDVKKKEADALREEAYGIRDYQNTVKDGINPQFIEWKRLETLEKIGAEGNLIMVIPDSSSGSMPLVYDASALLAAQTAQG